MLCSVPLHIALWLTRLDECWTNEQQKIVTGIFISILDSVSHKSNLMSFKYGLSSINFKSSLSTLLQIGLTKIHIARNARSSSLLKSISAP
jgi:hypothetical protein